MPDTSDESLGLQPYRPDEDHAFPDERVNDVLEFVGNDAEIQAYLEAQNVNPVSRLRYNDHGTKHVEIVRDRALCLYDLLKRGGVAFNARDQGLEEADEAVIIALAATLHDIGHVVHRDRHTYYSIPLAADVLDRVLSGFYDVGAALRVKGETLHAILCHHTAETPLTRDNSIPFYPHHVLKEMVVFPFFFLLLVGIVILFPPELGEKANPLSTPEGIKPEWYFLAPYQMLKLVPNKFLGISLQLVLVGIFLLWPFLDTGREDNILKRPLMLLIFFGSLVIWTILTLWGKYS